MIAKILDEHSGLIVPMVMALVIIVLFVGVGGAITYWNSYGAKNCAESCGLSGQKMSRYISGNGCICQ